MSTVHELFEFKDMISDLGFFDMWGDELKPRGEFLEVLKIFFTSF